MTILVNKIAWDTDGIKTALPKSLTLEVEPGFDLDDTADLLSDRYGYCIFGLSVEVLA